MADTKDTRIDNLFSTEVADKLFADIHGGQTTTHKLPTNVYKKIGSYLNEGVQAGFGKVDDSILFNELKTSVWRFSAAKTYQQVNDMQNALTNDDGTRKSFAEFKKEAEMIFDQYNKNWLATEHQAAVRQSQAANKWRDIERSKSVLPYLQFQTVNDDRVRPEHAEFDNITAPVDDPIWNTATPPLDWNCRCILIQLSEDEAEPTPQSEIDDLPEVPEDFAFNPGKERIIFSESHPYYDVAPRDEEWKNNNFGLDIPGQKPQTPEQ